MSELNTLLRPVMRQWAAEKRAVWGIKADRVHFRAAILTALRAQPSVKMSTPELQTVEAAVRQLEKRPLLVVHANYLVRHVQGYRTSTALGLSEAQYWQELNIAHAFVAGQLVLCHPSRFALDYERAIDAEWSSRWA